MTRLYPIVLETEDSGAVSAYVPGLPVYAAAETHAKAERAIRAVLTEYPERSPGQSARCSGPRGALLRRWEAEGRYRRRGRSGGRPSERDEGTRVARQWPAWWSPSHCRGRRTTPRQVSLSRNTVTVVRPAHPPLPHTCRLRQPYEPSAYEPSA